MPVNRKAHHTQLPATPPVRTMFVTRFGVSVLNVVATMDTPMSHQGAARPDVKNSAVLDPARRASTTAGMNDTTIDAMTMIQSRDVRRIWEFGRSFADGQDEFESGPGVWSGDARYGHGSPEPSGCCDSSARRSVPDAWMASTLRV